MQLKTKNLLAIYTTFALDNLAATIVFPIFSPLFLGTQHTIISPITPLAIKTIILGVFLASFPLGQLIFAPIVGEYADHHGRKRALLLTVLAAAIGYFFCGYAIKEKMLTLLFLGRFVIGIAAGNLSVCLVSINDLCQDIKQRSKYYVYGSILAGAMFVLGPFIGGRLSSPSVASFFSPDFPMWVGFSLSIINLVIILLLFTETRLPREGSFDFYKALESVFGCFKLHEIKEMYKKYFFYLFAWNLVFQFIPAILIKRYGASVVFIGDLSAVMGLFWILGGLASRGLFRLVHCTKIQILIFLALNAASSFILFTATEKNFFEVMLAVYVTTAGATWPLFSSYISEKIGNRDQGRVLGLSQSIQSFSMLVAPLVGGFILTKSGESLFIISGLCVCFSFILMLRKL